MHKPVILLYLFVILALFVSCDTKEYYTSSIIIQELIPPTPFQHTIFIGVTDTENLGESFVTTGIQIHPGASITNITIDPIVFKKKEDNKSNSTDIFLLVAEDTNDSGYFDDNDQYLPFSLLTLVDDIPLVITTIDFSSSIQYNHSLSKITYTILHSNPAAVDSTHKIFIKLYYGPTITYADYTLCKELIAFWTTEPPDSVYWDKDASSSQTSGDWLGSNSSSPDNLKHTFIISPF